MANMLSSLFLLVPLLCGVLVHGFADPDICTGACNGRDPGLIRRTSDGRFFRFNSNNKISVYSAPAIEGPWTSLGSMLPGCSVINLDGRCDLWAPDVYKVGDQYHVYYSVSTLGSRNSAIGLATSPTMEPGSWTDHGSIGVQTTTNDNYNAIDGNFFEDKDHSYSFLFGSYWGGIFQLDINSDGTKTSAMSTAKNIAYEPGWNHWIEGGYLYRNYDYYYLFYSWGKAGQYDINRPADGEEYKIKVCRATSRHGPFVGNAGRACTDGGGMTVLASHGVVYGPGGQGVITHPEHGPTLYYHYTNTTIGYSNAQQRFGWNPLDFSSGWPVAK